MIKADLNWLKQTLVNAEVYNLSEQRAKQEINYVVTDSRTIEAGQVFVALKGDNFDGTKFVQQVADKGAIAVVVETKQEVDIPQFVVPNALKAYGQIASQIAQESNVKTIAITGSSGKSTVKEMCAAILAQRGKVIATEGNFNNEVGVPHTLMRFNPDFDYAVVELGANHVGEIAYTQSLTKPDVAILNNVAQAHLEGFGGIQGVVKAKGEIFLGLKKKSEGLGRDGITSTAIVNGDSEFKQAWLSELAEVNTVQFTLDPKLAEQAGSISASNIKLDETGCASFDLLFEQQTTAIKLTLPGQHNVANALAASAACIAMGATRENLQAGLATMTGVKGRVNLHKLTSRLTLIDDTYNANVGSVKAAAKLLQGYQGSRVLVLGDMGELGEESEELHRQVGEYANSIGIDYLYACGPLGKFTCEAFGANAKHFSQQTELVEALSELINQSTQSMTLLFKGSRSSKMELVFQQVFEQFNNNHNKGH